MHIEKQIPLAAHTTLKVGGPADYFVRATSTEELCEAVRWARAETVPVLIVGGGSNVLIPDEGFRGLVIKNEITGIDILEDNDETVLLGVAAGEVFDACVAYTVEKGWWGLENLSHIPGSVGATPIQNVGAYGVEVKDVIEWVEVLNTKTDEVTKIENGACDFAYRDSLFKKEEGKKYVVLRVAYRVLKNAKPNIAYKDLATKFVHASNVTISEIRDAVITIRAEKFPDWRTVGTAGSFFKNPIITSRKYREILEKYPEMPGFELPDQMIKIPLGWVLDHVLGLRGYREGNIEAYKGQALVLVAHDGATTKEIEKFADEIAKKVFDATGITIEREVTTVT